MTLKILGGTLEPRQPGDDLPDAVYGVDASGRYLGVVPADEAHAQAPGPPPRHGHFRLVDGAWVRHKTRDQAVAEIEAERDSRIAAGVEWQGDVWYADQVFQSQLSSYLLMYAEGVLNPSDRCAVRTKGKVVKQLTRGELRALAAAVAAHVSGVWAWSWAQKATLGE